MTIPEGSPWGSHREGRFSANRAQARRHAVGPELGTAVQLLAADGQFLPLNPERFCPQAASFSAATANITAVA
jgi:hypothetical protein